MPKEDYYSILGVSKTATTDEINKAYKKLVVSKHPDKISHKNDEEKHHSTRHFQKIQKAKEILSDPEKRQLYDNYGEDGMNQAVAQQNSMRQQFKLQDIEHVITCTISELYNGTTKTISFTRQILTGNITPNNIFGMGSQLKVHGEEKCSITFNIPPKTSINQQIKLPNQGMRHISEDIYGDLVINLKPLEPVPESEIGWKQEGSDLHYSFDLPFEQSLLGFTRTITHPSNQKINFHCDEAINNTSKIIPNLGFKDGGNLIININVLPAKLTIQQRSQLQGIFNYTYTAPDSTSNSKNLANAKQYSKEKERGNMFNIGTNGINIGGLNFGNGNPFSGGSMPFGMNFNFGFG